MKNTKRILASVLAILLLLTGTPFAGFVTPANAQTQGDFSYTVSGGEATITGYSGTAADLVIPSELGGYPVTEIGDSAFFGCGATSVTIPNGVETIGYYAFAGCSSLETVSIPKSVTYIDNYAFLLAFSLTGITVDTQNEYYTSQDGVLYTKNKTSLICYPAAKTDSVFAVPDGVEFIKGAAFVCCDSLTAVTLPRSVRNIGIQAFDNCSELTQFTVLNPNCEIYDTASTIYSTAVIHGYDGSTAQQYATKYERSFVSLGAIPAVQAGNGGVSLEPNWTADKNGCISVDVFLDDCVGATSWKFDLTFDETVLEFHSVDGGDDVNESYKTKNNNITWECSDLYEENGVLELGGYMQRAMFTKEDFAAAAKSGYIVSIDPAHTHFVTVYFTVKDADAYKNSTVQFGIEGSISFQGYDDAPYYYAVGEDAQVRCSAEKAADIFYGDTDGDGLLTPADANSLLQTAVGMNTDTDIADIDGDGSVTPEDARLVFRAALGDESPSETGHWTTAFGGDEKEDHFPNVSLECDWTLEEDGEDTYIFVALYLNNAVGATSWLFDLTFDPDIFEYDGWTDGDFVWDLRLSRDNAIRLECGETSADEGKLQFGGYMRQALENLNRAHLAYFYFRVKDAAAFNRETLAMSIAGTVSYAGLTIAPYGYAKGDTVSVKETHKHIHDWQASTAIEPSCTAKGEKVYICTLNETHTYTEEIPALGHDYKATVTAPTCTKDGFTAYTCSHCSDSYTADTIPAAGHKHKTIVVPPTVTSQGYTAHICPCGDTYADNYVDPVVGENAFVKDDALVGLSDTTAATLLAQISEGATLKKADGTAKKADEKVGTGDKLVLSDGTEIIISVLGDINGDGEVATSDARLVLRKAVNLETFNDAQDTAARVDGGEKVDVAHARKILRASVNLEKAEDWFKALAK